MWKKALVIGDGATIRGAVVTRNVPPYAIVQGCPAHIVGYRFDQTLINQLLELRWWDQNNEWLVKHTRFFDDPKKLIEEIDQERQCSKR